MEFDENTLKQIEKAKIAKDSIEGLSEKEKEIVFTRMVDKILNITKIESEAILKNTTPTPVESLRGFNIQELYHDLNPKTNVDIVMLIAFYYFHQKKQFTVREIQENFKLLLLQAPANTSDVINKNRMKGLVMVHGENEKKNIIFTITRKGISYVENGFKQQSDP